VLLGEVVLSSVRSKICGELLRIHFTSGSLEILFDGLLMSLEKKYKEVEFSESNLSVSVNIGQMQYTVDLFLESSEVF